MSNGERSNNHKTNQRISTEQSGGDHEAAAECLQDKAADPKSKLIAFTALSNEWIYFS